MIIALDWDKTYTEDTVLFSEFVKIAESRGHTVIIVTARPESHQIANPPSGIDVVYADHEWKYSASLKAGYKVDIWIDDMPNMIMPQGKLDF